ncbi:DUF2993 domain-containing protein [Blastococcus saxobsidens]|uniref:DUF2993 domain-containing protein n=1 Tax=Blastococcus saxobsidens TaxID=138336 RepID=A0A6L9W672_9ACTN|nr:DUF2993 domain-containing protein [Blastococcus saxobsidens]NEK87548.1 DUF2993 domain-containing protein [Blastococcus saxobsidens]
MNVLSALRIRISTAVLAASVLLGTALLLWGADALARWTAESYVARQVQALTGVLELPAVEVHGTFFLPQVLSGRYEHVEIAVEDLRSGPLRLERMTADLSGVHVSFADLVGQDVVPIYIEESEERATLTFEDLNHYLDATGRPVRVESAPAGEVLLTGTVEVFGREVSASSRVVVGADDGSLSVRPTGLETGTVLDAAGQALLRQRFTFLVPMDPLPFGQRIEGITTGETAFEIEAGGDGLLVEP